MGKCPHCGAEFEFDAKSQMVHCDYCGSDFNPQELEEKSNSAKLNGNCYSCTQCGATLMTFDETAVTFCSYCGSQNMIEEKMMVQNVPDFIIPFSKTKEECIHNYKKKLSSFFFTPSYMKSDLVIKKFRGIYMPYGVYKLAFKGDCINKGEKYSHRSGDYVYYTDYKIHADVDATYDGISFDLVSKYYDEFSHAIPFSFKGAKEFNTNYLPGFYADVKDVDIETYNKEAINIGTIDSKRFLLKNRTFARYNCRNPKVAFQIDNKKIGMFPVYFVAIHNKKDPNSIHYAVINGQTGKVAADLPIDFAKYIIFSIILAIPIYFCLSVLPVVLPIVLNFFSIIAAIIAGIICIYQISACHNKKMHYDDKGYLSVMEPDEKVDGKKKKNKKRESAKYDSKYIMKYVCAILVSILVICLKPVNDFYYYLAAMVSLAFVLWSFFDLIQLHNQLVSNPIPQLNKRGGDDHE